MEQKVPRTISFTFDEDPLTILRRCGGYYDCPKGPDGKRRGPLVGYAGTYDPDKTLHFVGDVYANFAKAETFPAVLDFYAKQLMFRIPDAILDKIDVFCGAPMGGLALAQDLGRLTHRRYVYAEKKVIQVAEPGKREKSELIFGRHEVFPGDGVAIVEDVTNNFSTTDALISLIEQAGAKVVTIVSLLNRSLAVENCYVGQKHWIPVISLIRKPFPEYRQDEAEVADDLAAGNIVWKPKPEWDKLEQAMASA